jgi:hypothetical protein
MVPVGAGVGGVGTGATDVVVVGTGPSVEPLPVPVTGTVSGVDDVVGRLVREVSRPGADVAGGPTATGPGDR